MSGNQSENAGNCESNECADDKSDKSKPEKEKSFIDRFWIFAESHIPSTIDENSEAGKRRNHCKEEIKFWLEICGFVIGIIVAGIFLYQSLEMRKATIGAESQLREMQQNRILDERAWITPFDMEVGNDSVLTNGIIFELKFKNTGRTPALNVSEWHHVGFGLESLPTNDITVPKASLLIAPEGIFWLKIGPIDNQEADAIKNGWTMPLYVSGKVTYDDIFGKSHWTTFCWGVGRGFSFRAALIHNSCDDAQANQSN